MKNIIRNIMVGLISLTLVAGSIFMATRNPPVDGWGWVCFGGIVVLGSLALEKKEDEE
jgi:hypothetical protein